MRPLARAGLALPVAAALLLAACGKDRDRPNLVLVTIDTMRGDHWAGMGHDRVKTPWLDRFARTAVTFSEDVTVVPTTLASHSTLLTGLQPRSHGIPRNGFPLAENAVTLAEILHDEGYQTGGFVAAYCLSREFGTSQGFDHFDDEMDFREPDQAQRRAPRVLGPALTWLNQRDPKRPFFLWVHLFDPHFPYDPPPPWDQLYGDGKGTDADGSFAFLKQLWAGALAPTPDRTERLRELYEGEVSYTDHALGSLFRALDSPGLAGSAVVCVTADHGDSFGEHGYLFSHGLRVYSPTTHVPLVLSWPAGEGRPPAAAGRVITEPVSSVDVFPTLLELLGVRAPHGIEGRSLLPILRGEPWEAARMYSEASQPWEMEEGLPEGAWKNVRKDKAVRVGRYKLVWSPWEETEALYDMVEDPGELASLEDAIPEVADRLREDLHAWNEGRPVLETEPLDTEEARRKLEALGYIGGR